jgi:predicted RNase H-like nuclease (RuvC/YqgF family)
MVENSGMQDVERAMQILGRLVTEYPDSAWRPPAQFILQERARLEQLESQVAERDARIKTIATELETTRIRETDLRAQLDQLHQSTGQEKKDSDARIRQLTSSLEETKERIQVLTTELEALKKIDIQRRPSRPPPQ